MSNYTDNLQSTFNAGREIIATIEPQLDALCQALQADQRSAIIGTDQIVLWFRPRSDAKKSTAGDAIKGIMPDFVTFIPDSTASQWVRASTQINGIEIDICVYCYGQEEA